MKEKELWDKYGSIQKCSEFKIGPHFSYQFEKSPRHVLFTLSRYKFALKMIGDYKKILELGCSDGLGTYYLSEFADRVLGVDFDSESINWAKKNLERNNLEFLCSDFLGNKYGEFDAIVSYDVIEHIYPENEVSFFETVVKNLATNGVFIIGTPNIESSRFSKKEVSNAHVNMYSGKRLISILEKYFNNVFLFGQNDEIIHTGYTPMAHYLICLCCSKK